MKTRRTSGMWIVLAAILMLGSGADAQTGHRPPPSYPMRLLPSRESIHYNVERVDFTVTLRDSVILDAVKFLPIAPIPSGGWPSVIMVHGFGLNKDSLARFCEAQASYGYYVATFSVRGQGNSGGLSNLISTTEAEDLVEFVAFVKTDTASNPGRILVMGGSQGGLLPLMAASRFGMEVRTIISALAPANFASSWIENGCIKTTFLWTISYPADFARYTPLVSEMSGWVYADTKQAWDSLAYWLPRNRDFMDAVPDNAVPLILEGSWQDAFFNGSGIIRSTSLMQVPFRMYMGAVMGHGGDTSSTENRWHEEFYNTWVAYWLLGVENGVLNAPRYEFAYTASPVNGTHWTFVHDSANTWPPPSVSPWRLYPHAGGGLLPSPNPNPAETAVLRNQCSPELTLRQAVEDEFTGDRFNRMFVKREVVFETDPLPADHTMLGVPRMSLRYFSTGAPFCQYNFQIYEVFPDSSASFVDRLNFTDRNYEADTIHVAAFEGQAHGHIFRAGSRIRLVLTNLDTAPGDEVFLWTNPFVLPVLIDAYNHVVLDEHSYIELPILGLPTGLAEDFEPGTPARLSLSQNYPNPFNPVTNFKFEIPGGTQDAVSLRVYDILGREVATLVNEVKQPGSYAVTWDASGVASGVYFCRLQQGGMAQTRKLLLLR